MIKQCWFIIFVFACSAFADPETSPADRLVQRGEYCLENDDAKGAEQFFFKALAKDKDHPRAFLGLGESALLKGQWAEADRFFRGAMKRGAGHYKVYKGIGIGHFESGRKDSAIIYFEKALKKNPKDKELHLYLAFIYREQKNDTKAAEHAGAALKLDPNYEDAAYILEELDVPLIIKKTKKDTARKVEELTPETIE